MRVKTMLGREYQIPDREWEAASVAALRPCSQRVLQEIIAEAMDYRWTTLPYRWWRRFGIALRDLQAHGFIEIRGPFSQGRGHLDLKGYQKHGNRWHSPKPNSRLGWARVAKKVRPLVYERDGYRCRACKSTTDLSVDHIIPVVMGGSNDLSNLQTLCRRCNCGKGGRYGKGALAQTRLL